MTSSDPPTPLDLALGDTGEDHPRRLLRIGNDLVAYGGDLGVISVVNDTGDNAAVARRFDDAVRAIAISHDGKRVAVGFEDGSTQIFLYENVNSSDKKHPFLQKATSEQNDDDFMSQSLLSQDEENMGITKGETTFPGPRFSVPIRDLQFDPTSNYLCIASEEGVCIVDATSSSKLEERFLQDMADKEHQASGIRGVSYTQVKDKVYLATLDMTGRLCVWDVTGDDPAIDYELLHRDSHKCIAKADVGEIHNADPYDRSSVPLFIKDTSLVLPGMTDVQLRCCDSFDKQHFLVSLEEKGHTDSIVAMVSSPDGKHLATSGRDGRVIIWSIDAEDDDAKGKFVCELGQYDSIPTRMLWEERKGKQVLYMACANGMLRSIEGCNHIIIQEETSSAGEGSHEDVTTQNKFETQPILKKPTKDTAIDDDSDDDVDFTANGSKKSVKFVAEEAEEDNDADTVEMARKEGKALTTEGTEIRDDQDDGSMGADDYGDDYGGYEERRMTNAPLPEPQPPFAPSATPLDLRRRIMCWNQIGTISYQRDDEGGTRNTVDIDFTEAATRRPISFSDNMDFILGSLGEDGAIFASDLTGDDDDDDDEDGKIVDGLNMSERTKKLLKRSLKRRMNKGDGRQPTGSKVYFHRFETFGAPRDKDWLLTLPDGERVIGCACGEGWSAVVTSRRFLRLFSSGGNQGQVIWLNGDPVTIVGRGRFLAVVYHESSPLPDGTQKLGYTLFDAEASSVITSGSVSSISSGSQLEWAGFSSDGSLVVMDSDGMVSMLVTTPSSRDALQYSWDWSPMLDTVGLHKSADDKFWPITVQDGKLISVPLKGGNDYPDAGRRPVTAALPFRMPLARSLIEKSSALEEISVRANLALTQKKFVNEIVAVDDPDKEELDAEYDGLCAQVDKVTLKLFMNMADAGKVESALDLVDRLHLEKSFEIAITVADRLNHRNLSDRIVDKKEARFMVDDPMDDFAQDDYEPRYGEFASKEGLADEDEVMSTSSRRISPDGNSSRNLKRSIDDVSGDENEDQWDRPEKKFRGGGKAKKTLHKLANPFAKQRIESPAKPPLSPVKSPAKLALSRSSTFSAQSREKSKVSKRIL